MQSVVIGIGVNSFNGVAEKPLRFVENDATTFLNTLKSAVGDPCQITCLVGPKATYKHITQAVAEVLNSTTPTDRIFFYLSAPALSLDGTNLITCADTKLLAGTQGRDASILNIIELDWLIQQFHDAAYKHLYLFCDLQNCELPATSTQTRFEILDQSALQNFFNATESAHCFMSADARHPPRVNLKAKHGLWNGLLISAFSGQAHNAYTPQRTLTVTRLQRFLESECAATTRVLFSGVEPQKPVHYGKSGSRTELVRFSEKLRPHGNADASTHDRAAGNVSAINLDHVTILHEQSLPIRKLSGFKKTTGHYLPEQVSQASEKFLSNISAQELEADVDLVFQNLKSVYRLKRRDIVANVTETGGTVITPFFEYEISIRIDPLDTKNAIIRRQVSKIRTPEKVLVPEFDKAFENRFRAIEIRLKDANLSDMIDQIEDLDSELITLNYDKSLTSLTIQIEGINAEILVTPKAMSVHQKTSTNLVELIRAFLQMQAILKHELNLSH